MKKRCDDRGFNTNLNCTLSPRKGISVDVGRATEMKDIDWFTRPAHPQYAPRLPGMAVAISASMKVGIYVEFASKKPLINKLFDRRY